MEMSLLVLLLFEAWNICGGVEVVNLELVGDTGYATVQEKTRDLTCSYKLAPDERFATVTFGRNAELLSHATGPAQPNPATVYSSVARLDTRSRGKEGLVTCAVLTSKVKDGHSNKTLMLYIADTPVTPVHKDSSSKNQCVMKLSYASVESDPPLQTKCGIWVFDSPTDTTKGKWLDDDNLDFQGSYSSETEGEFKIIGGTGKKFSFELKDVKYKLNQLPKDKKMEHRCNRYYKFGSERTTVRMHLSHTSLALHEPYKQRCPALAPHGAHESFNLTVTEPSKDWMTDCQGMWYTNKRQPIMAAKLKCEHDLSELSVECEDFEWKKAKFEMEGKEKAIMETQEQSDGVEIVDADVEDFVEKCRKQGNAASLQLGSFALLVTTAGLLMTTS